MTTVTDTTPISDEAEDDISLLDLLQTVVDNLRLVVLGPLATQILGDWGADVIKLEPPEGDLMRANGVSTVPGMSSIFLAINRNKRSLAIDLKQPAGIEAVKRLLPTVDVLVHNMRTAAIDTRVIPRRTVLFIRETVGLKMPDGSLHDGYWYASDTGGAIKGNRIDLFTGSGSASMKPIMGLNLAHLTVSPVGQFKGCPPA
jgi:hypothetical protein